MSVDIPNTRRNRPAAVFGLRAAALAGLIVVAGMPVAEPISALTERDNGVVTELVFAGRYEGSTCCPSPVARYED